MAPPDETLFCPKCLQNQHLLTELLASYHPPATDTDDSAYEVEYPNYRARLEEQHPQVCEECEPRVRERLRATGYAAKTDHLRRMMERTREIKGRTRLIEVGWRNIVVTAGACGWWASLAGQAIWNIIGATGGVQREDGLRSEETAITLSSCVHQCLRHGTVDTGCAEWTTSIAGPALLLGTMSIWWNNRLKVRVGGSGYRLVGLNEYYKLQVVILVARFCSLAMLQHGTITDPSSTASRAAHIFMLIFLVIVRPSRRW